MNYYALYINKKKGIMKVIRNPELDIDVEEIKSFAKKYNDWYYYSKSFNSIIKLFDEKKEKIKLKVA